MIMNIAAFCVNGLIKLKYDWSKYFLTETDSPNKLPEKKLELVALKEK